MMWVRIVMRKELRMSEIWEWSGEEGGGGLIIIGGTCCAGGAALGHMVSAGYIVGVCLHCSWGCFRHFPCGSFPRKLLSVLLHDYGPLPQSPPTHSFMPLSYPIHFIPSFQLSFLIFLLPTWIDVYFQSFSFLHLA